MGLNHMNTNKCKIFTGGAPIHCGAFSEKDFQGCFIIAADSGCAQIERLCSHGITVHPDILLGDMDSYSREKALSAFPDAEFIKFPPEKDYTDTQLAVSIACDKGYKDIEIIGGTGNRADHYLANLSLMRKYASCGINLSINDGKNKISYQKSGNIVIDNDGKFKYFSLLPDGTELSDVYIDGAKYPLNGACIDRDMPITVSNEITADKCNIKVGNGSFFLILCSD